MTELNILCINFNYAKFLVENQTVWQQAAADADNFLIIDDQSSRQDAAYNRISDVFGKRFISTTHPKSPFNGVNQMRAIDYGLGLLGVQDDSYYWVIDADDAPVEFAVSTVKECIEKNPQIELFAFSRQEITGDARHLERPGQPHPFWLRNAPTSSLVVKGSSLNRARSKLFNDRRFRDVWFDIRLSACIPQNKSMVSDTISHEKNNHAENDSARYRTKKLRTLLRIFNSLLYKYLT